MGLSESPSERDLISKDAKKTFLLEIMKECDKRKIHLKSEVERSLSLPSPLHVRNDMIEKAIDEVFSDLSKFLVNKTRKQLDRQGAVVLTPTAASRDEDQEKIQKLETNLENESTALQEANIVLARQAEELERLNTQLKQLQMEISPIEGSSSSGSQEKINQLQKDLKIEQLAVKEVNSILEEQREEISRLKQISKEFDETQLWLTQVLGETDSKGDLKNQVRSLVKTIIDSSKRLSRYKDQEQQASHDIEAYQRMFIIVDLLSEEDSTVRALRILSERENMSIKELADATGQNSLVLKMKLRRFARSGAIELDDEGNVRFALKSGDSSNE
ncbi:MAG: hypothetical protein ACFFGZ_12715 [Candidatus Thorarchaeota archaeon]